MNKIGIGITTYNRPECLKQCVEHITKHTDMSNATLYIAEDTDIDRKGVAFRKNECLRTLQDCDHIFLFDDDCYPVKDAWVEYLTTLGRNHLLFMNDKLHRKSHTSTKCYCYADCGGVFIYVNKSTLKKVGAMNEDYGLWGFEHAEWSNRIERTTGMYFMAIRTAEFIYSNDYSVPGFTSSISNEEKNLMFQKNFPLYKKGYKNRYIPL